MKKNHFSHPLRLRLSLAVICAALCVLCAGLAAPPAAAYASEDTPALGESGDENLSGAGETSAPALGEGNEGYVKPAWYPVDPENFAEYHDETAPRVVDDADIFTDEEEVRMENRLSELRAELQKDIVIYTDMSAYGFGHDILAADFYDFNGYGIGDDYEGVVLFICMDPADRGWWACCTGPQTRGLYTEEVANQIDDLLYEYMSQGMYYEGVSDWIENFRRLYRNGSPYLDDWAMQDLATFERFHSEDAPRVVDEIGLFSESELPSLAKTAQDLSREYSADVVIHTALAPGTLRDEEYADRFYCFGGYGEGDEFDGIELTVFKRPGYMAYPVVTAYGKCAGKLTGTNKKRLENRCLASLESKNYRDAVLGWLEQTGHMLRTGRAPHSSFHWIVITVLAAIAGSVLGAISLARASSRMSTPAIAENADAYYVEGSLKMRRVSDTLVDTRTSRQYSPRETRSSGGSSSSGGRSSYSSSYKGSSGRSHSGSGRKF